MDSKPERTHVVGEPDQRVLRPVQVQMVALGPSRVRVVADEADFLVCGRRVAVENRPPPDRGQVGDGAV